MYTAGISSEDQRKIAHDTNENIFHFGILLITPIHVYPVNSGNQRKLL